MSIFEAQIVSEAYIELLLDHRNNHGLKSGSFHRFQILQFNQFAENSMSISQQKYIPGFTSTGGGTRSSSHHG
jgi:hypothetical protein